MLLLLLVGVVAATNSVTTTRNQSTCSYTLTVPDGQCGGGTNQQAMVTQMVLLEKQGEDYKQKLKIQELLTTQLSMKIERLTKSMAIQENFLSGQGYRIKMLEDTLKQHGLEYKKYVDCAELRLGGYNTDGVYNITLEHALSPINVWCDMTTNNGGWTLIQRRQDGSVYFYRDWDDYKKGFGDANGEYWLGNDNIYHLTNQKTYLLRVDMWDFDNKHFVAEYDQFYIENELHKYKLHVGSYNGTAGDAMTYHNNRVFSAKYRDATNICAFGYKGAFWYGGCAYANLNGNYHNDNKYIGNDAIFWYQLNNNFKALKKVEMKVRPMTFHKK